MRGTITNAYFLSYFKISWESLDSEEIKPVSPKGNQPWIVTGRTDGEAEVPILWPPDAKSQFIGKDSDAGKDWGKEKGVTQDEMVGRHHQLNGHEFEQIQGNSEGQGSLACCSPWGSQRVKHNLMTEQRCPSSFGCHKLKKISSSLDQQPGKK